MKLIGMTAGGSVVVELNLADVKRMRELGESLACLPAEAPAPTADINDHAAAQKQTRNRCQVPASMLPKADKAKARKCVGCGKAIGTGSRCWPCRKAFEADRKGKVVTVKPDGTQDRSAVVIEKFCQACGVKFKASGPAAKYCVECKAKNQG